MSTCPCLLPQRRVGDNVATEQARWQANDGRCGEDPNGGLYHHPSSG
jgi:hypothetical protein